METDQHPRAARLRVGNPRRARGAVSLSSNRESSKMADKTHYTLNDVLKVVRVCGLAGKHWTVTRDRIANRAPVANVREKCRAGIEKTLKLFPSQKPELEHILSDAFLTAPEEGGSDEPAG
jgi:hypothetical protein